MHAAIMANGGKYLTLRDVLGTIADEVVARASCLWRGHAPVRVDVRTRLCRRCYRPMR